MSRASDLYALYLQASQAYHQHLNTCPSCEPGGLRQCGVGVRLLEIRAHRDNDYLKHQKEQRG
ncbi:hypothetical protein [Streptomyces cavernicola]|uniref:Uncharacterized protein n=1 Tax=Streptomyces cavernicola TaxID=3043613 RepID=A0ABT6SJE4_9ACTN|nr:hypothetical protein [Streptomyces sp. B-S-A6]MDI3408313.1 hypothetical protein [Streptomyces sp. B-S-A6]